MSNLDTTLTKLEDTRTWGPNWNSYSAVAPNPLAITRAKEWITEFHHCIQQWQLTWIEPNVLAEPATGASVFEWYHQERSMTLYVDVDEIYVLQVWGHTIDAKITDATITETSQCEALWRWLTHSEETTE